MCQLHESLQLMDALRATLLSPSSIICYKKSLTLHLRQNTLTPICKQKRAQNITIVSNTHCGESSLHDVVKRRVNEKGKIDA